MRRCRGDDGEGGTDTHEKSPVDVEQNSNRGDETSDGSRLAERSQKGPCAPIDGDGGLEEHEHCGICIRPPPTAALMLALIVLY